MPKSQATDVVIIGGGHNGLVCAAFLARAGLAVTVLEKNAALGGAAATEEFHPGFRNSVAAYTVSLLDPGVIRGLDLPRHGLRIVPRPFANFWPADARRSLLLPWDGAGRQAAIAAFSVRDAGRLPAFEAALRRAAGILAGLARETPPNAGGGLRSLFRAVRLSRRFLNLPLADQRLLFDLFTKSASSFLERWFENETVKAAFAFDSIVGTYAPPSAPGTAYVLLHHAFGEVNGRPGQWGHAMGGMGAISAAIAAAARAAGAHLRTEAEVTGLLLRKGRAAGVILASGGTVTARAVAAAIPPKLLFCRIVPEDAVPEETRTRLTGLTSGSGSFRMNVALSELPDFLCRPGRTPQDHHKAGIVIGPTPGYLEEAWWDARRSGWSTRPVIEMLIPSLLDAGLAPPGRHVASLFVQHVAPHLPAGRSWADPAEKERFAKLVVDTMAEHAPNFGRAVLARQVLSPLDLETRFGLVDGDIFHGQMLPDQLFWARPMLGHAEYRMPVLGLYLCGAGAHPGGGVTGLPGRNAAREILRDFSRSWRSGLR